MSLTLTNWRKLMSDLDKTLGDTVEGRKDEAVGEAKQDLGKTTGDKALVEEGRAQEAAGAIRQGVATAESAVDHAADNAREALNGDS
jgi:uncharacterized protein YjbJ (UPF0337 family)